MGFLKKDLYIIITKFYMRIFMCLFSLVLLRGSIFGAISINNLPVVNPDIIYIDITNNNFSIANFLLIFSFIGWGTPARLFKIDNEVMEYLITAPKKNLQLLWSKILASTILMVPLLIINMVIFKCLTFNVFIITFFIGLIFIICASITSFLTNKKFAFVATSLISIGGIFLVIVDNPIVRWINENTQIYAFSQAFPLMIILKLILWLLVSIVFVNILFTLHIRRVRNNG